MKRYLKFYDKDKQFVKMSNQSEKGFDLIILSDDILKQIIETINNCEENGDTLNVVWQMKFKLKNLVLYKDCTFSAPIDNIYKKRGDITPKSYGKKIKVKCSGSEFYSEDEAYIDNNVLNPKNYFWSKIPKVTKYIKYKNGKQFNRKLKINNLHLKCDEYEDFIKTIKIKKDE
jgi:hypothetical protein